MRLTNPAAEQLRTAVFAAEAASRIGKHTSNRTLDAAAVAEAVVKAVAAQPAGAIDFNGGTSATAYPARTCCIAVAWYTRLDGTKVVRLKGKAVRIKDAKVVPLAPYNAGEFAESVIAAGGFPALVSDGLLSVLSQLKGTETGFGAALYANPGDLTAWGAFADYLDESGKPEPAAFIRRRVGVAVKV